MKAGAREMKMKIMGEMKVARRDETEGLGASDYRCGALEIMRIANAGHKTMVVANEDNQTVLGGKRRNGFFAYRPDIWKVSEARYAELV